MTQSQFPAGDPHDPSAYHGPPPGYPNPAYPQQGYPQQGYPPPNYPPQNPYAYPNPYPYGYPSGPANPADNRPGLAMASAVLAFITSGLLILAGLLLFLGGTIAGDIEDSADSGTHIGVELALDGVVNLVAGGLLIAGGVALLGRRAQSRIMLSVAGGIVTAAAIYWLTRFDEDAGASWGFDAGLFLVLTTLVVTFAWTTPVTRWLTRRT